VGLHRFRLTFLGGFIHRVERSRFKEPASREGDMEKRRASPEPSVGISMERAGRLYHLLAALAEGAESRATLMKRLRSGLRTFYRDLDLLRSLGVDVRTEVDGYSLHTSLEEALSYVPFPDPELTFGDVMTLMRGRSQAHRKLKQLFQQTTA
jgi:hypothetical protein